MTTPENTPENRDRVAQKIVETLSIEDLMNEMKARLEEEFENSYPVFREAYNVYINDK